MLRTDLPSLRAALIPVLAVATGVALAVNPAAAVASGPVATYSAAVSPPNGAGGTTTTFTVQLTQLVDIGSERSETNTIELGSAQVAPPAGFTITGASAAIGTTVVPAVLSTNTVTLNNLEIHHAGQSLTITITATIPCAVSGSVSWTVVAHQTDSYTNTGAVALLQDPASRLTTQISPCSLAFASTGEPANAGAGQNITSQPANPAGPPVAVRLSDGNGNPLAMAGIPVTLGIVAGTGTAGAVLAGTTTVATGVGGTALFGALSIAQSGLGYQLAATSPGIVPGTSTAFDISDVLTQCSGSCSGSDSRGDTSATVSATTAAGAVLSMSLGLDTISCNDAADRFYVSTSQVLTFGLTPAVTSKTVTITLAKSSVIRSFNRYQVCFSSPTTGFTNRYGVAIPPGGAGLLPDCRGTDDDPSPADTSTWSHSPTPPCVLHRSKDRQGNVTVTFLVPPGDPRGQI